MMTNTALTLYQRVLVSKQETWTRVSVERVHWENRKAANVISSGLLEADAVSVWIPLQGRLTLAIKPGDILVKGSVTDEIVAAVPEDPGPPVVPGTPAFTVTDLKTKYPDTVVVKSVDRYDFGSPSMWHLRIGAS